MWHLSVAKESILIADYIFKCKKSLKTDKEVFELWEKDFKFLTKIIRKYEFGAVVIDYENRLYLLFIDKSGFPLMCGYTTVGVTYLLSSINNFGVNYDLITKAGKVSGLIEKENKNFISVKMPFAEVLSKKIDVNCRIATRADIAKCGNSFVLCRTNNLIEHTIKEIKNYSANIKSKYPVDGVLWYSILSSNENRIKTRSITIFGEENQVYLSPCGTGSSSLAILFKNEKFKNNFVLESYSLSGNKFCIKFPTKSNSPTLYLSDSIIAEYNENSNSFYAKNTNWSVVKMKEYFINV